MLASEPVGKALVPALEVYEPKQAFLPPKLNEELYSALERARDRHLAISRKKGKVDLSVLEGASRYVEPSRPVTLPSATIRQKNLLPEPPVQQICLEPHTIVFAVGDSVEYWSNTRQLWATATIVAVIHHPDTGVLMQYQLDGKAHVKPHLVRLVGANSVDAPKAHVKPHLERQSSVDAPILPSLTGSDIEVGMPLQCWSPQVVGEWKWEDAVVLAKLGVGPDVEVDMNCNQQFLKSVPLNCLRLPPYCPKVGEQVSYYSVSNNRWVTTRCLRVFWRRKQFEFDLDCKRAATLPSIRRSSETKDAYALDDVYVQPGASSKAASPAVVGKMHDSIGNTGTALHKNRKSGAVHLPSPPLRRVPTRDAHADSQDEDIAGSFLKDNWQDEMWTMLYEADPTESTAIAPSTIIPKSARQASPLPERGSMPSKSANRSSQVTRSKARDSSPIAVGTDVRRVRCARSASRRASTRQGHRGGHQSRSASRGRGQRTKNGDAERGGRRDAAVVAGPKGRSRSRHESNRPPQYSSRQQRW